MDAPDNDPTANTAAAPPADTGDAAAALPMLRGVRVAEALARFGGDRARYRHWLAEFVEYGPGTAVRLRQAIAGGASATAIALAHALKGRTGMLGMSELHSISHSLEQALRNGEPSLMWLDELESVVDEMRQQIETAFGARPE